MNWLYKIKVRFVDKINKCKCIAAVNRVLDEIYNEVDISKVWCGL